MILQRFLELRPAIAFERAEHVAGQAFAVQADQRRLAAERADHQRDMLLPVVRGAEGDDLRVGQVRRAAAWRARRSRPPAARSSRAISSAETARRRVWRIEQPQRRQQPRRARQLERGCRPSPRSRAAPDAAGRSARDRDRGPGSASASAVSASSHVARSISTGCAGSAASRSLASDERRRALAADQQLRFAAGIERCRAAPASPSRPPAIATGIGALDPHRPPGAKRGDRPPDRRRVAQTSISQISGTWSDGRSQLRHGSSTSCALRWPASSGEAHIWSSRRPRSFLVQSGER